MWRRWRLRTCRVYNCPKEYNTSMTTINDINDFARIIREQPEWADTIRSLERAG